MPKDVHSLFYYILYKQRNNQCMKTVAYSFTRQWNTQWAALCDTDNNKKIIIKISNNICVTDAKHHEMDQNMFHKTFNDISYRWKGHRLIMFEYEGNPGMNKTNELSDKL